MFTGRHSFMARLAEDVIIWPKCDPANFHAIGLWLLVSIHCLYERLLVLVM